MDRFYFFFLAARGPLFVGPIRVICTHSNVLNNNDVAVCDRSTIVYVQIRKVLANNERCCHIRMTLGVCMLRNGRSSGSIVHGTELETEPTSRSGMVIIEAKGELC